MQRLIWTSDKPETGRVVLVAWPGRRHGSLILFVDGVGYFHGRWRASREVGLTRASGPGPLHAAQ